MNLKRYKSIYKEDWNDDQTKVILYKDDLTWQAVRTGDTVETSVAKGDRPLRVTKVVKFDAKNVGRANQATGEDRAIKWMNDSVKKQLDTGYTLQKGQTVGSLSTHKSPDAMLAGKFDPKIVLPEEIYIQPKLDGIRCLANTSDGSLWSRQHKPILIPHLSELIANLGITEVEWLDGELYTHGKGFQTLSGAIRKGTNDDSKKAVQYHIYDCVKTSNYDARYKIISKVAKDADRIQKNVIHLVESHLIKLDEIDDYTTKFINDGYEGAMLRIPNSPYIQKRSNALLKVKRFTEDDFEIVGFNKEGGDIRKETTLGTFILKAKNGKLFRAAPKMSDAEKKEIWDEKESYIGQIANVKYQELSDDGIPRFANVLGIKFEQ